MYRLVCSERTFWKCRELFLEPKGSILSLDQYLLPGIKSIYINGQLVEITYINKNDRNAAEKLIADWELSQR